MKFIYIFNLGGKTLTNVAYMWYVPVSIDPPFTTCSVAPMLYKSSEEEAEGRKALEKQRAERNVSNGSKNRMRSFSLSTPLDSGNYSI